MPTYLFRCDDCGDTERAFTMAAKPDSIHCPGCQEPARSVVASPHLGVGGSPAARLIDTTERSAETPAVVSRVPGASRRRQEVSRDPRHAKLPRN
ncbi:FmdB family zinc ribbon protein [Brevibacterium metallidurans]|uniref:Zinc ribbon domain-containing protein n=1 Tax=Brevibacterium metallidurans TaxID=1482676 RepID=A0ABN0SST9_9MICO